MSRSYRTPGSPSANSRLFPSKTSAGAPDMRQGGPGITALSIEFVAKPDVAHNVQGSLPAAIHGALGEVAGFAGGFVLIANYEARLVTVVTLWTGEERKRRCHDNLKWVRALLTPYQDRCLRVQTLAAYVPEAKVSVEELRPAVEEFVPAPDQIVTTENEGVAVYAA